jgi:hypothetical protein
MKPLQMKKCNQIGKEQALVGKRLSEWDVDAAGKVLNYPDQFQAKFALLKKAGQPLLMQTDSRRE